MNTSINSLGDYEEQKRLQNDDDEEDESADITPTYGVLGGLR